MRVNPCSLFMVAAASMLICTTAWAAHPAEGYEPNEVRNYYQGPPPVWSNGDISFVDPDSKPDEDSLTDIECYILAGCPDSATGAALPSWIESMYMAASKYYAAFGQLPSVMDEQELRKIAEFKQMPASMINIYRNPITGQWPTLNATTPSPGNLYIRPLASAEQSHIAAVSPRYKKLWFDGKTGDWDNADSHDALDSLYSVPVNLMGPPFYIRVYGQEGVLWNDFAATYTGVNHQF